MDPLSMAAMFGPLVMELGKSLIGRFVAPDKVKPVNVAEAIQLMQAETARFNAINSAGGTGQTYPWVEAIVRLQRPAIVMVTALVWGGVASGQFLVGQESMNLVNGFAQAVAFYLFGDRTLSYAVGNFKQKGGSK